MGETVEDYTSWTCEVSAAQWCKFDVEVSNKTNTSSAPEAGVLKIGAKKIDIQDFDPKNNVTYDIKISLQTKPAFPISSELAKATFIIRSNSSPLVASAKQVRVKSNPAVTPVQSAPEGSKTAKYNVGCSETVVAKIPYNPYKKEISTCGNQAQRKGTPEKRAGMVCNGASQGKWSYIIILLVSSLPN